jgi:hypothetical protein
VTHRSHAAFLEDTEGRIALGPLWKFYKNSLVVWPTHLVSIVIALFAPFNVLTELPLLRRVVDTVAAIFPVIHNFGTRSSFSEVTELYFTCMILIAPFWWWAAARDRYMKASVAAWHVRLRREKHVLLRSLALAAISLPVAWFGLFINPGYDFKLLPVNSSRLALAVYGPIFAHSPFWVLAIAGVMVQGAIRNMSRGSS